MLTGKGAWLAGELRRAGALKHAIRVAKAYPAEDAPLSGVFGHSTADGGFFIADPIVFPYP